MSILRVFHNSTDILSNVKTGSYTTVMPDSDTQIYVKSTDQDKPVVTIVRDTYNSYHFEVTDNVSIQQYCHTTGADASGCTWMDINQSKVSTIATGVKYNDNSTSQTISDTAPQTWSVYVRDAAGNVSDKVAGTSTISSYAVTRSRTVTDGSASDITLTIRYDATSDDSSKPNFADDSKTMYMLHGTPIYIVASAGSGFTLTELKLNDTDILSNKGGYQHDISNMTDIKSVAYKAILQAQEYVQDVTKLVCDNTTTPNASIKLTGSASNYNEYASEHSDRTGIHGVELEAKANSSHRNYVPEAILKDRRSCDANGSNCTQSYMVRKLADGKCWIAQNLELDLEKDYELTPTFTDVSSSVIPVTNSSYSTTALSSLTSRISWPADGYARSYNPKYDADNANVKSSTITSLPRNENNKNLLYLKNSSGTFSFSTTGIETERRGNFYNWLAATALSGSTSTNISGTSSICPAGFTLPVGGAVGSPGSYYYLYTTYSGTSGDYYRYPISFSPSGCYYTSSLGVTHTGIMALGWASTSVDATSAYSLRMRYNSTNDLGTVAHNKGFGFSVRCVSK